MNYLISLLYERGPCVRVPSYLLVFVYCFEYFVVILFVVRTCVTRTCTIFLFLKFFFLSVICNRCVCVCEIWFCINQVNIVVFYKMYFFQNNDALCILKNASLACLDMDLPNQT